MLQGKDLRERWAFSVGQGKDLHELRALAQEHDLGKEGFRSVLWKLYLEYLPSPDTSTWAIALGKERGVYKDYCEKFIVDPNRPTEASPTSGDPAEDKAISHHPLSQDGESPWVQFFEDAELSKTIDSDVQRTFPDLPYFREEANQEMLSRILLIYCKLHEDVSYRQGMHELAAIILRIVDLDALPEDTDLSSITDPKILPIIRLTLSKENVEADAFALFTRLMSAAKPWYEFKDEPPRHKRAHGRGTSIDAQGAALPADLPTTPILRKAHRIHHEYLQTIDPLLYAHLQKLEIEPQIYILRWVRLLFGREFPLAQVHRLWDAIFADDRQLGLVDWMCISMQEFIREDLLESDFGDCLGRLMHFPAMPWQGQDGRIGLTDLIHWAQRFRDHPTALTGSTIRREHAVTDDREVEWQEREKDRIERPLSPSAYGDRRIGPIQLSPSLLKAGVAVGRSLVEFKNNPTMQSYLQRVGKVATQGLHPPQRANSFGENLKGDGHRFSEALLRAEAAEAALLQQSALHEEVGKAVDLVRRALEDLKTQGIENPTLEGGSDLLLSITKALRGETDSIPTPSFLAHLDAASPTEHIDVDTTASTSLPAETKPKEIAKEIAKESAKEKKKEKAKEKEKAKSKKKAAESPAPNLESTLSGPIPTHSPSSTGRSITPAPKKAPRTITVEDLMKEVGESKTVSKHDWLFGAGAGAGSGSGSDSVASGSGSVGRSAGGNAVKRTARSGTSPSPSGFGSGTSEPFLPSPRTPRAKAAPPLGERVDPMADPLRPIPRAPSPPIPAALAARLKQGSVPSKGGVGLGVSTSSRSEGDRQVAIQAEARAEGDTRSGSLPPSQPSYIAPLIPGGGGIRGIVLPVNHAADGIASSHNLLDPLAALGGPSHDKKRGKKHRVITPDADARAGSNSRKVSAASFLSEVEGFEGRVQAERVAAAESKRTRDGLPPNRRELDPSRIGEDRRAEEAEEEASRRDGVLDDMVWGSHSIGDPPAASLTSGLLLRGDEEEGLLGGFVSTNARHIDPDLLSHRNPPPPLDRSPHPGAILPPEESSIWGVGGEEESGDEDTPIASLQHRPRAISIDMFSEPEMIGPGISEEGFGFDSAAIATLPISSADPISLHGHDGLGEEDEEDHEGIRSWAPIGPAAGDSLGDGSNSSSPGAVLVPAAGADDLDSAHIHGMSMGGWDGPKHTGSILHAEEDNDHAHPPHHPPSHLSEGVAWHSSTTQEGDNPWS